MKSRRFPCWSLLPLLLVGCVTTRTVELEYLPGKVSPTPASRVRVAVIPFEDTTWNGQEDHQWVGQASLYGEKLLGTASISQMVTRSVKREIEAGGPDALRSIRQTKAGQGKDSEVIFQQGLGAIPFEG